MGPVSATTVVWRRIIGETASRTAWIKIGWETTENRDDRVWWGREEAEGGGT